MFICQLFDIFQNNKKITFGHLIIVSNVMYISLPFRVSLSCLAVSSEAPVVLIFIISPKIQAKIKIGKR